MTPRSFVYLVGAAVLSVVLAGLTFVANNQWTGGPVRGARLMPMLENAIGQVHEVTIKQGETTVALERKGGSWALKSRDGYPADIAKVRSLLVALGQAELVEPKTSKADKYPLLELEDPAGKGAKSRHVLLTDAKGNLIAEAVLGKTRSDGFGVGKATGTYVRRPGTPQTWLANVEINVPLGIKDWAKTSVLALDATKIDRVTIEIAGEQPLRIARAPAASKEAKDKDAKADGKDAKAPKTDGKDAKAEGKDDAKDTAKDTKVEPGKLAFVDFPGEGKKLKDAYAAEALTRAVASIDLEDLRKLTAPPPADGASVVKIERADGLVATYTLRKDGDAHWLSIAVAGEGDAKKAADEIAARTKDWEFKLPASKVELILKKRSDLVETSEAKG
jgi:hypothetical protein